MPALPACQTYILLACLATTGALAAPAVPDPLARLLAAHPALAEVASDPDHEVQIRYTQIDRDAAGNPTFRTFEHGVDPGRYFYPASTVKLPIALIALEKLRAADLPGLTPDTTMLTGTAHPWQSAAQTDPGSPTGLPNIRTYIRRVFLASDNNASNRLYEFVGPDLLNHSLGQKGFPGIRIFHRLSVRRQPWHGRHTNPVHFIGGDGQPVLVQPATEDKIDHASPHPIPKGSGYVTHLGELVRQPMDFAGLNAFPLSAQQEILKALVFPTAVPPAARFNITQADRALVLKAMGQFPRESEWPPYDPTDFPDSYTKFLLFGSSNARAPSGLRSFNKSGMAYGTLTDNAYIAAPEEHIEFLLAATILTNSDGIFNDDQYEYDTVGLPFLLHLGKAIYQLEQSRPKTHPPDLSHLTSLINKP